MSDPTRVIGYARFRDTPEIAARYSLHQPGRWYPVVNKRTEGAESMTPAGMVWLDMGLIRSVPLEDVEFRPDPPEPASG